MPLRNNVFLVTGASTGIGEALALRLAERGASLVLTARRLAELQRVEAAIVAKGGQALAVACDVTRREDNVQAVQQAVARFGSLDGLVLNAGATMWARFEDIADPALLERLMQVNYMGAVYGVHAALPHLKKSRGRIVGIASLTALTGVPTRSGYAASKHAMRGFFDSLRIELADSGVTVTMVYPGFVATGIRENATAADGAAARVDPVDPKKVMSLEACVSLIVPAIEERRREVVMTGKAKLAQWIKLIAPGLVDRMAAQAVAANQAHVERQLEALDKGA
ncbi:MAG: SDR family oxidoreductase [Betaproteobacteria bacterium]|nr:SDR family oxidoreductase [Betaproteobacteria bacterium]